MWPIQFTLRKENLTEKIRVRGIGINTCKNDYMNIKEIGYENV